MSNKATIAVVLSTIGLAVAGSPFAASAAERCAPGTPAGPYCIRQAIGIESSQHKALVSRKDIVHLVVRCSFTTECKGALLLVGKGRKRVKGRKKFKVLPIVYGRASYHVGPLGKKKIAIKLDAKGRKALAAHHVLKVKVVAIERAHREVIDQLTIKQFKPRKHPKKSAKPHAGKG